MPDFEEILLSMRNNPKGVRFSDLVKVCTHYFGKPRTRGSHHCFSSPWDGKPMINLQNDGGKAKAYQVKQVLAAIELLKGADDA